MSEPLFTQDGASFVATPQSAGPWSPDFVQGSASAALLARAVEAEPTARGAHVARLAFDLWRPAPLGRLSVRTRLLRDGRKAKTVEAVLLAGEAEVARCTALLLRRAEVALPSAARPPAPAPFEAGAPIPPHVRAWSPYFEGVETRVVAGALEKPGPASAWFWLRRPLVAGEANSPLVHAVAAADLASGISAVVDLRRISFVNPDLVLSFVRAPAGERMLVEAETEVGEHGVGLARARLHDEKGPFGWASLSLLFEPRAA